MLNGVNPVSSEQAFLKNTIKHLRGELGKYNSMVKYVLERSMTAQNLIKQYEELTKRYEKELQNIDELKERRDVLDGKIDVLQL